MIEDIKFIDKRSNRQHFVVFYPDFLKIVVEIVTAAFYWLFAFQTNVDVCSCFSETWALNLLSSFCLSHFPAGNSDLRLQARLISETAMPGGHAVADPVGFEVTCFSE